MCLIFKVFSLTFSESRSATVVASHSLVVSGSSAKYVTWLCVMCCSKDAYG